MKRRRRTQPQRCAHCLALEYKLAKLAPAEGDILILRLPTETSAFDSERLLADLNRAAPEVTCVAVRGDIEPSIARGLMLAEFH